MKTTFAAMHPYLAYWIEDWGEMQTTNGEYQSRLILLDEGGERYEDDGSQTIDEAFEKAEAYIRHELAHELFDQESIDALEEDYQNYGLV